MSRSWACVDRAHKIKLDVILYFWNHRRKQSNGRLIEVNSKINLNYEFCIKYIYFLGKDVIRDLLLFSLFVNKKNNYLTVKELLHYTEKCEIPKFPITGNYLKKLGYETGRVLGKKLKSLEEKWIANNFILEEEVIKKSLEKTNQD